MPANGMLLLLDRMIIKGMRIYCLCIVMELLSHYNHVIVRSYKRASLLVVLAGSHQ